MEQISQFPKNKWGIPEPYVSPEEILAAQVPLVDAVIVPAVAFDKCRRRLGHGKGYYDCFLNRLLEARTAENLEPARTIVSSMILFTSRPYTN
jgi:5-formyltetrahydrofolate cyclo-ligase